MTARIPVELGPVQETLLIPLLGRAHETKRKRGLVQDEQAVQIVEQLDYDFAKWKRAKSLVGASLRTRMFDDYLKRLLTEHPTSTVVELGCGLNTRFERLDNGAAQWFEIDLPDVIALRRRFFEDTHRRTMIAGSVLDSDWVPQVKATGGPWVFVSEAVIIYLDAHEARRAIVDLAANFPGATLVFDTTCRKMVETQREHDAMRHLPRASWCRWACDDPREIESWGAGFRLVASKTFLDAGPELVSRFPMSLRLTARFAPFLLRSKVSGYRLNLAVADGTGKE